MISPSCYNSEHFQRITDLFFYYRTSAASTLSEEIESMTDKLNYLKFDEVVQHLKYVDASLFYIDDTVPGTS